MCLGEKIKIKKRIKNAINMIKKYEKVKSSSISKYLAIFLHYNTQQLILHKWTVKPFA